MYLVASVRLSVHLSVRLSPLSRLNRLTYDLDILPTAVKSNNTHCQSKVLVCVSIISRCMWIIVQMRSIGFYYVTIQMLSSKSNTILIFTS